MDRLNFCKKTNEQQKQCEKDFNTSTQVSGTNLTLDGLLELVSCAVEFGDFLQMLCDQLLLVHNAALRANVPLFVAFHARVRCCGCGCCWGEQL
jgi:hypothetical protein